MIFPTIVNTNQHQLPLHSVRDLLKWKDPFTNLFWKFYIFLKPRIEQEIMYLEEVKVWEINRYIVFNKVYYTSRPKFFNYFSIYSIQ